MRTRAAIAALLTALIWAGPTAAQEHAELPAPVLAVRFENSGGLNYDDLAADLSFQVGDIVSNEELVNAVQRLKQRGVFSSVSFDVAPLGSGVEVTFLLKPAVRVADVNFQGNFTIQSLTLRRRSRIQAGEQLDRGKINAAVEQIRALYREQGFRHADVKPEIREDRTFHDARVVFYIDEGYRSRINVIVVSDGLPDLLADLQRTLQSEFVNRPASQNTFKDLKRRALALVRNEGFLQASARLEDSAASAPDQADRAVTLTLTLREPLTIVFSGNRQFDETELLAPLKLETRTVPFSPNAGRRLCRDIAELYETHGYFFAQVQCAEGENTPERRYYHVNIEEGPLTRVERLNFEGNESVSDGALKGVMETKPAGWWFLKRWAPGFLQKQTLVNDLAAIEELYRSRGFHRAGAAFKLEKLEKRSALAVNVSIDEGPRSYITSVDVRWRGLAQRLLPGSEAIDRDELDVMYFGPRINVGDPFAADDIARAGQELNERLLSGGYPNAKVAVRDDPAGGSVEFVVTPGPFVRVGEIKTAGNLFTHDVVLTRELTLFPGERFSEDEREKTEQAVSQLGLFRAVSLAPSDGVYDSAVEDMTITVKERETGSFDAGLAYDTEDGIHLTTELAQRNLEGLGQGLVLGVDGYFRSGARVFDAGRARAAYTRPHILGSDATLQTEGFIQTSIQLFDDFSYDRAGASSYLVFNPAEKVEVSAGPLAYLERLYDVDEDVQIGPDDFGTHNYSMLTGEGVIDLRDDPFNPRRGILTSLRWRYASRSFGSDIAFGGVYGSQLFFTPLSQRLVWLNKVGYSLVEPFNGTEVVPLSQRVFLGGRATLRGYARNSIAPRGETANVVGGDEGVNFTTELQRDVSESLVLAFFLDGGQSVLRNKGSYTGDPLSLSDLRYSPGIGIRYKTPIGPVLLDFGVPLKRNYGERPIRLNFGIGLAY